MNDQKMETVYVIPEKIDSDLIGDVIEDPEKQLTDLVDTNPTIDDQQESDDDDAIVCYNFTSKSKEDKSSDQELSANQDVVEDSSSNEQSKQETVEKEKEKEIDPIVLQQPQEEDVLDNSVRNRKESLDIITMALNERKLSNLKNYNKFATKRSTYYEQIASTLIKIEQQGLKNLNETETFGKQLVKSLKEIKQAYKNFHRDLNKISFGALETKDNSLWGRIVPNGFKLITQYKNTCSDASRVFYEWLDSECISKIEEVFSQAKDKIQAEYKDVKKTRESFSILNLKNLVISEETKVKDLLFQQLKFNKLIQQQKNKVQEWGASASRLLETIYTKDSQILSMLKFEVASLVGHLKMIGRQSHHLFQAENYWVGIPSDQQTMFNRIINDWRMIQKKQAFPQGKQIKMQQVHNYLILNNQESVVGNLKSILRQLQINTYKLQLQFDRNDWKPVQAYFSVDNHLIFVDEHSTVKNCMNIIQLQYQIHELELKIRQKQRGIFATWNKEKLKFKSCNQMEEFIMLIDSMKDLRLQQ